MNHTPEFHAAIREGNRLKHAGLPNAVTVALPLHCAHWQPTGKKTGTCAIGAMPGPLHISACSGCPQRAVPAGYVQPVAPVAKAPPVPASGPGTELKRLLRIVGIVATPNCSCNAYAAQMDQWGPDECENRKGEILGWLAKEAAARGLPFIPVVGRIIVAAAINNARKGAA